MWKKLVAVLFACVLFTACGTPTKEPTEDRPGEIDTPDEENIAPEGDDMDDDFNDERDEMEDDQIEEDQDNNEMDENEGDEERNKNDG